jgi:hypothetical protein
MLCKERDEGHRQGIGFGQIIKINKKENTVVIQVDVFTWQLMWKCDIKYSLGVDRTLLNAYEWANGIFFYRIKARANLNHLGFDFGTLIKFQWNMCESCSENGIGIMVERVEPALESLWSRPIEPGILFDDPDSDDEYEENDDTDGGCSRDAEPQSEDKKPKKSIIEIRKALFKTKLKPKQTK